jgi:hypothetical protein
MPIPQFGAESFDLRIIEHLLASGEMVSAQMPSPSRWSPERKLAGAVLASALIEVRDRHADPKYRRKVAEDLEWIRSDDADWPYAFVPLCHVFGLEPEYVRAVVARWLQAVPAARLRQCSTHRVAA